MKKRGNKGQVTIFVILGLMVLIIVGIFIFLVSQKKLEPVDETDVYLQNYDAKLSPIYNDVVFCMDILGKEALVKIGSNGGYLDIAPNLYAYDRYVEHTNNALELFPESEIVLPYWKYIQGSPDCAECIEVQKVPLLEGSYDSIQKQTERYISQNLVSCVNDFSEYEFDLTINYGTPNVSVIFRDELTFIGLDWPINVTFGNEVKSESLRYFSTTLDLKMRKIYTLALDTLFQMEMVGDSRAFEHFTSDILSFYSFGGEDAEIPPVSGPVIVGFSEPRFWLLKDVKTTLKNAVSENTNYMQVIGSKDSYYPYEMDLIEKTTYVKLQNKIYTDEEYLTTTRIRFNYFPNWPMYVSVNPGSEVIMPESTGMINMLFFQVGSTKYKFDYDITYPVLVTLEDDEAFKGEGYLFEYPFEVNIRSNKPYSNESILIQSADYPEFEQNDYSNYIQRTVPVKLNVINGYNGEPEPNVLISYACLDTAITLGVSEITDGQAVIDSALPPCIGGKFSVVTRNYSMPEIIEDIVLDNPLEKTLKVYPEKEITLSLKKINFAPTKIPENINDAIDRDWKIVSGEGLLNIIQDEEVIFLMSEIRADAGQPRVQFLNLNFTNNEGTLKLTPGDYNVQIISILHLGEGYSRNSIIIPKRTITQGTFITGTEEIELNETVFNETLYLGGINFDENTGYFNISAENLTNSEIIFYYPSYDPVDLKFLEDLNVLGLIQEVQTTYPDKFIPKFE
ncbi:MAG: hypothetical protein ACP5N2_04275 [Candidatus Nanoarchaeia archaeon]